jgi:hypothetical protein
MSRLLCGRLTRYWFPFKSLGLEFVVLSLCGALSDERPGLSFSKSQSSNLSVCTFPINTRDEATCKAGQVTWGDTLPQFPSTTKAMFVSWRLSFGRDTRLSKGADQC